MKLTGNVKIKIVVSGKNNRECGSKENSCRFQHYSKDSLCLLFRKKLRYRTTAYGWLRCKECQEAIKK